MARPRKITTDQVYISLLSLLLATPLGGTRPNAREIRDRVVEDWIEEGVAEEERGKRLSVATVYRRLKELEKEGRIWRNGWTVEGRGVELRTEEDGR